MSQAIEDEPPPSAYDRAHMKHYMRLLDASRIGADWRDAARLILGLDAIAEPSRARRVHDAHLARAEWMCERGYRGLLEKGPAA